MLTITIRYSLPQHIRQHVDYITPGVKFSATLKRTTVKRSESVYHKPGPFKTLPSDDAWTPPSAALTLPADLTDCGRNITPACIKALYQIPNATLHDHRNKLGLFEQGDTYAQEDLDSFFAEYAPYVPQGTHPKLDSIDGGEAPVAPGDEANTGESDIDMDIAYSLIYVSSATNNINANDH